MKTKKSLGVVLAAIAQTVLAWVIWVAIGITVIAVGGYCVWKLYQVAKRINQQPNTQTTNTVERVWINNGDSNVLAYSTLGADDPAGPPVNFAAFNPTIQYGLDATPWISVDENIPAARLIPSLDGQSVIVLSAGAAIAFWPDLSCEVLDKDDSPHTVVIERTEDFILWTPVFTNTVFRYDVNGWNDNVAPESKAFYRLRFEQ